MTITRCPACATCFRVTAEQLKRRAGRVRCGQCREAFDALEHLLDPLTAAAAPGAPPEAALTGAQTVAGPADVPNEMAQPADSPPTAAGTEAESALDFEPEQGPDTAAAEAAPADAPPAHETPAPPALAPPRTAMRAEQPDEAAAPEPEPSRREPSRALVWTWGLLAVTALLALAANGVYAWREQIAWRFPTAKPLLAAACEPLGCTIGLPRQPDLVSVEASELRPDPRQRGQLVLSTTLKNRAEFDQAYPHLELTLTDVGDQVMARRVFAPAEYLSTPGEAALGFRAQADVAVTLLLDASAVTATGYRVYVFYP